MSYVHDNPDDPLDLCQLHALHRGEEYGVDGWQVVLHVPNEAVAAVLERWGPK